ncbi:MAG: zinc chelation protein SecC [Desulfomonilaceae bacterium]
MKAALFRNHVKQKSEDEAMTVHESLLLPFDMPPPLEPREVMDPYEPCWCQSGKKWKWCHKDRELQEPVHFGAQMAELLAEMTKGYCSHPSASKLTCGDRIIRAHTVQRRGGLAAISEGGHVISIKDGMRDILKNEGRVVPRKAGISDASTFMGFCDSHDAAMFRPIEVGAPVLSRENAFLLSFRALAYELFTKRTVLRSIPIQREMDRGKPFYIQVAIQQYLNLNAQGMIRGLRDLTKWKLEYDSAYLSECCDAYSFYAVAFSEVLPVVSCGGFHPEFDFEANPLQRIGRGDVDFDHMTFNLTSLNGKGVAVFGWTQSESGPAEAFVNSFKCLPDSEKADAVLHLAFEQIENTYVRPSWWDQLSEEERQSVIQRFLSGVPGIIGTERQRDCLSNRSVTYVSAEVTEEFK